MVFEKLGDNLLTFIKRFDYRGIPLHYVKDIARQVCARETPAPPPPCLGSCCRSHHALQRILLIIGDPRCL